MDFNKRNLCRWLRSSTKRRWCQKQEQGLIKPSDEGGVRGFRLVSFLFLLIDAAILQIVSLAALWRTSSHLAASMVQMIQSCSQWGGSIMESSLIDLYPSDRPAFADVKLHSQAQVKRKMEAYLDKRPFWLKA
ncbi:hypothetical protein BHE74_00008295 [Ensete ventricosum]|nr:hypothetical protein GW17_00022580 [Ensete ventricosum]RWW83206.1 hypothetical protein BHE74_00008295 [Ensete ventricosum]RZR78922.1 hypothetical protein BHM03_00004482 [Ensete ventricosum]